MTGVGRRMLQTWCVLLVSLVPVSAQCPWLGKDLKKWHDPTAWPDNKVPGENDAVVIPANSQILLNAQPAVLGSLTIEAGGALVWGDVDNLTLSTHFILIKGGFHVGSQACRFTKRANIRLLGMSNSTFFVDGEEEFFRKFIGVTAGASLELHGKKKTSWTKLSQTLRPPDQVPCATVYDHSDAAKSPFGSERGVGLHVIVWHLDGSLLDFAVLRPPYKTFTAFFDTVPKGKVLGVFSYGKAGVLGKLPDAARAILQSLGGQKISQVETGDTYSFIALTGDTTSAVECMEKKSARGDGSSYGYLGLHVKETKLVFQVARSNSEMFKYFRVVQEDVAFPILTLKDEVTGWEAGDEILVLSTDFDWEQAETRKIISCDACNKRQIRVDKPFNYIHYGNFTFGVDERAEVAMLTRSIKIEGVMQPQCYHHDDVGKRLCKYYDKDTFGGHLRIARNHKSAHIRGVELFHMGQQKRLGGYPLHFHMCDDASGSYLRENTVHHSFSRCFTIHGTNNTEVSDNVCWQHLGHGLFVEDGVEQNNLFSGNLVAGSQYGTLLLSDMTKDYCDTYHKEWATNCGDLSSYWITHPNNIFTGNVAAGGDGHGFMYSFPDRPLGPSLKRQQENGIPHHPKDMPLFFTRNVAHSNDNNGVFVDSKVSTGTGMENKGMVPENGVIQSENEYDPHIDGKPVWVNMSYGTYYKNGEGDMWIKGGNIRVTYTTMADSSEGFSGGTTLFNTGAEVFRSVFIGETENKGLGRKRSIPSEAVPSNQKAVLYFDRSFSGLPTDSLTAVGLYQGPVFIKECFFDKFLTKQWCVDDKSSTDCDDKQLVTRYAGAISFKRNNNYPTMTSSYVENNRFGFCDNDEGQHYVFQGDPSILDWQWKDGNKAIFFRDKDGKLTGTVNASVVPDYPLYSGPECLKKPDWGDLQVCPYRYVKLEILGSTGNLDSKHQRDYPMMIKRDDKPYQETFSVKGEIRNEYLLRTHRSYIIDFNDTKKTGGFPHEYKLYGYGVEKQDVVRVGICQPLDVQNYTVNTNYPTVLRNYNATWVSSLQELDDDDTGMALFHDKKRGIVFFKMWSRDQDTNDTQQCPDGKCWWLKITIQGDYTKKLRSCFGYNIEPYTDPNVPVPKKPEPQPCRGKETADGLGSVDWSNVGFVEHSEFQVQCPKEHKKLGGERLGCYIEKANKKSFLLQLIDTELIEYVNSMTPAVCINRCYYRGYMYAGLSRGRRCTCGNVAPAAELEIADKAKADKACSMKCVGDPAQTCGSKKHQQVYSTGSPVGKENSPPVGFTQ